MLHATSQALMHVNSHTVLLIRVTLMQSGSESISSKSRALLQFSRRIQATDDPIMVQSSRIVGGVKNPHNLGQGIKALRFVSTVSP